MIKQEFNSDLIEQLKWIQVNTETVLLSDLRQCSLDIRCTYKRKNILMHLEVARAYFEQLSKF